MMEPSIVEFRQYFYIPAIRKFAFHLLHVQIVGTHHCGNTHQEEFKRRSGFRDMLCRHDWVEHVVSRFSHQILC